jgi:hypothetical protein
VHLNSTHARLRADRSFLTSQTRAKPSDTGVSFSVYTAIMNQAGKVRQQLPVGITVLPLLRARHCPGRGRGAGERNAKALLGHMEPRP